MKSLVYLNYKNNKIKFEIYKRWKLCRNYYKLMIMGEIILNNYIYLNRRWNRNILFLINLGNIRCMWEELD